MQVTPGEEVLDAREAIRTGQRAGSRSWSCCGRARAAERAAVLDRRRERSLTAAVKADRSTVVEDVGAGRDVDQPHSSQPEFGRERAHNQGDAADPAGVENAAEAGETVGQHYPVDAKLHIGVIVADVQQSAGRRILRDARRLQQDSSTGVLSPPGSALIVD